MKKLFVTLFIFSIVVFECLAGWSRMFDSTTDKNKNRYELTHSGPAEKIWLTKYDKKGKEIWSVNLWNDEESKDGFYVAVDQSGKITLKELYQCSFKNEDHSMVFEGETLFVRVLFARK